MRQLPWQRIAINCKQMQSVNPCQAIAADCSCCIVITAQHGWHHSRSCHCSDMDSCNTTAAMTAAVARLQSGRKERPATGAEVRCSQPGLDSVNVQLKFVCPGDLVDRGRCPGAVTCASETCTYGHRGSRSGLHTAQPICINTATRCRSISNHLSHSSAA